jgi:hypothetical protein
MDEHVGRKKYPGIYMPIAQQAAITINSESIVPAILKRDRAVMAREARHPNPLTFYTETDNDSYAVKHHEAAFFIPDQYYALRQSKAGAYNPNTPVWTDWAGLCLDINNPDYIGPQFRGIVTAGNNLEEVEISTTQVSVLSAGTISTLNTGDYPISTGDFVIWKPPRTKANERTGKLYPARPLIKGVPDNKLLVETYAITPTKNGVGHPFVQFWNALNLHNWNVQLAVDELPEDMPYVRAIFKGPNDPEAKKFYEKDPIFNLIQKYISTRNDLSDRDKENATIVLKLFQECKEHQEKMFTHLMGEAINSSGIGSQLDIMVKTQA